MKRRYPLLLLVTVTMIAVAALAPSRPSGLLLLDWAAKAKPEQPPVAILIQMGLKDQQPTAWSGAAHVQGAKVVHREGYAFRDSDKLIDPDGWEASSRRPIRVPRNAPQVAAQEGIGSVGVILHLSDLQPDATLTLEPKDTALGKVSVPMKDVLTGHRQLVWDGKAAVRLLSTATPLVTAKTEDDFPSAAYGPDGTLWVAFISYTLKDESRRIEQEPLQGQPADFKAFYRPEFGDRLQVKYYRDGGWSEATVVGDAAEDLVRCAIGVEGNGTPWVIYSANRGGNYDVYARPVNLQTPAAVKNPAPRLGPEQRLTNSPTPDLGPVACTDQSGQLWLACQSWGDDGTARIQLLRCKDGKWGPGPELPGQRKSENRWYPALAAGPDGKVAVAYDVYHQRDYDIHVAVINGSQVVDQPVATSAKFEARPSVAYDARGRLWIAYEEGTENWGKDFGALDRRGTPLYKARSVRVACLENNQLLKPAAELPTSVSNQPDPNERVPRYAYPRLGLDGQGRVWLCYRQKFGTRYSTHPGSYWISFVRRLDGDQWGPPVELNHSDGLLDSRPVLLPHVSGGLLAIHNSDGRFTTPEQIDNQIYASIVTLPGEPIEPKLVSQEAGTKDGKAAAAEAAAVQRIRDYRIESEGKRLQLLRGEFHRHTEISWDGGPDGSLEDMFRYAIDGAAMDWISNADHDNGAGREYPWWLTQKFTDAYHVAKAFTPLFGYERSVSYPHGHRNCIFVRRGILTLPRLSEPDPAKRVAGIHADDAKMFYRYLKELDGICASHTSATGMGTDWRDNDPVVEPLVEIYQGDRNNYEYQGAPRAGYDPNGDKKPAAIGGWRPAGFIDLAFRKGYRFGFQSSSDHWSTHISFCVALAERHDREGIMAALKKRHCYAATDDIILDVRSGNHLQGDEFKTSDTPALQFHVIGTEPLARIDILKDSAVVDTITPSGQEHRGEWKDPKPTGGTHYYYVRVEQKDGALAWASPMWIELVK
jgi:hypothetical protein